MALSKVKNLTELAGILSRLKSQGKKIVHCHGVFDLLHVGHTRHLREAKEQGDVLIVTITGDGCIDKGIGRPVFNAEYRAEALANLAFVDYIAVIHSATAVETIKLLKPDVYCKGEDVADNNKEGMIKNRPLYQEEQAIKEVGGRIYFTMNTGLIQSSSELLNKFFPVFPKETKEFLTKFKNQYSAGQIQNCLDQIQKIKVLFIGETIIDQYAYVATLGKAPKDDNLSTIYSHYQKFAGGVIACANLAANFCQKIDVISVMGHNNEEYNWLKKNLKKNVTAKLYQNQGGKTIIKRRYLDPAFYRKLFEVNIIDKGNFLDKELEQKILRQLEQTISQYDAVIVMDYGHGLMTRNIIEFLFQRAKFLAVSTETNSANAGFNLITQKYSRADYICLDKPELQLAAHDQQSDLKKLIKQIAEQLEAKKIIITLGHRGALVYDSHNYMHIPIFSQKVVDTTGADDAYFAVSSLLASQDIPLPMAGFVGNVIGALAVEILGTQKDIKCYSAVNYIKTLLK
ncbi:MAG: PfkB family carbohydrate kinase [Patescibacteria group bacterium]|jgi:rfaE bifunctional protein nucleotidyltransferase chain/domain